MNRFKSFLSTLVMILFMSSQALADRVGYSDDGYGTGILILLVLLVVCTFVALLVMSAGKS